MRLLLDEMYAPAVAAELRTLGHDVVSVHRALGRLVHEDEELRDRSVFLELESE